MEYLTLGVLFSRSYPTVYIHMYLYVYYDLEAKFRNMYGVYILLKDLEKIKNNLDECIFSMNGSQYDKTKCAKYYYHLLNDKPIMTPNLISFSRDITHVLERDIHESFLSMNDIEWRVLSFIIKQDGNIENSIDYSSKCFWDRTSFNRHIMEFIIENNLMSKNNDNIHIQTLIAFGRALTTIF